MADGMADGIASSACPTTQSVPARASQLGRTPSERERGERRRPGAGRAAGLVVEVHELLEGEEVVAELLGVRLQRAHAGEHRLGPAARLLDRLVLHLVVPLLRLGPQLPTPADSGQRPRPRFLRTSHKAREGRAAGVEKPKDGQQYNSPRRLAGSGWAQASPLGRRETFPREREIGP